MASDRVLYVVFCAAPPVPEIETMIGLAQWALGISDTLALGLLIEGIGKGLPLVSLPCFNWI